MGFNQTGPPLCQVSYRAPFFVPCCFFLHINDIMSDIESEIKLFADDCVCYREIKNIEDTLKLQKDIDRLGIWAIKLGMRFQPVKCNMMQLTKTRITRLMLHTRLRVQFLKMLKASNTSVLQLLVI